MKTNINLRNVDEGLKIQYTMIPGTLQDEANKHFNNLPLPMRNCHTFDQFCYLTKELPV